MTQAEWHRAAGSVLIVDNSDENREVLRTILQRQGISILEAERLEEGLEILRRQHPNVVVVDLEAADDASHGMDDMYQHESRRHEASLVVLGRVSRSIDVTASRVIAKPYHYGPLIRTIEQLLDQQ